MFLQKKGLSCLGEYGGPVFPYVALGGVGDDNYENATALIITLMVQNHLNEDDNLDAIEWEKKFVFFFFLSFYDIGYDSVNQENILNSRYS